MSDDKDFDFNKRKKKVENFEVEIRNSGSEAEPMEDLMSYSNGSKKVHAGTKRKDLKNIHTVKKSAQNVKLFKMVWVGMIVSVCIMLAQFVVFGTLDMLALTRQDSVLTVEIPKGASKSRVADILHENGVINQPTFFKLYLFFTKGTQKFIPGTFEIKANLDYEAIVNYLQSNANRVDTDTVSVTIPEGKNIMEIAAILEENEICLATEFIDVCKSPKFSKYYKLYEDEASQKDVIFLAEGSLYPDTYLFLKNTEPEFVVKKMTNNFANKISMNSFIDESNEKVSIKTLAARKSISIKDLIIIASLIQAEASNDEDMLGISAVIENRLNTLKNGGLSPFGDAINGCLCMDSTVWYPYRNRDKVPQEARENYESPYDTYKKRGLPSGPICNPGMAAIEAVLNHKSTQYYFFCDNKDGKIFYAKTFAEHNVNLKKAGVT